MEYIEICQHIKSALDLNLNLSLSLKLKTNNLKDDIAILAYLVLLLFRLNALPFIVLILFVSFLFELTFNIPESQFYILCSIACSYVTMYYYNQNNRVCIGVALMSLYMFLMGQESVINVISEDFYLSLYDSYEVCVSFIHVIIIALFIKWRKVYNTLAKFINDARGWWNCFNHLCSIL